LHKFRPFEVFISEFLDLLWIHIVMFIDVFGIYLYVFVVKQMRDYHKYSNCDAETLTESLPGNACIPEHQHGIKDNA